MYLCICICMYDTSKHHFGHPCTKFKRYNMSIGFMPLKVLGRNEIQEGGGGGGRGQIPVVSSAPNFKFRSW